MCPRDFGYWPANRPTQAEGGFHTGQAVCLRWRARHEAEGLIGDSPDCGRACRMVPRRGWVRADDFCAMLVLCLMCYGSSSSLSVYLSASRGTARARPRMCIVCAWGRVGRLAPARSAGVSQHSHPCASGGSRPAGRGHGRRRHRRSFRVQIGARQAAAFAGDTARRSVPGEAPPARPREPSDLQAAPQPGLQRPCSIWLPVPAAHAR